LRATAAYPGDDPDHPPYEEGVETPYTNILRFLFHINSSAPNQQLLTDCYTLSDSPYVHQGLHALSVVLMAGIWKNGKISCPIIANCARASSPGHKGRTTNFAAPASTYCWIRSAMCSVVPTALTAVKGTSGRWRVTNEAACETAFCPSGEM